MVTSEYAVDINGNRVHISKVARGAACNCTCEICGKPILACKGPVRVHHFKHRKDDLCETAEETAIHKLAKEIIMREQAIMLPEVAEHPSGLVKLHNVVCEKHDEELNITPDVEGIMENGERLLIEFYVTHKVPHGKRKKIINNKLRCIEIDLNYVGADEEGLRSFLLNDTKDKEWVETLLTGGDSSDSPYGYGRSKVHIKAIEYMKERFDKESLSIGFFNPWQDDFEDFVLKRLEYDVCEKKTRSFRGIRADLMLYRSMKGSKGYIAICFRQRKRNMDRVPRGLRIIDIILKEDYELENLKDTPVLRDGGNIQFHGFKYDEKHHLL